MDKSRSRRGFHFLPSRYARIACMYVRTPALLYGKSAVNHCRRGVCDIGSHSVVGGLKLTR